MRLPAVAIAAAFTSGIAFGLHPAVARNASSGQSSFFFFHGHSCIRHDLHRAVSIRPQDRNARILQSFEKFRSPYGLFSPAEIIPTRGCGQQLRDQLLCCMPPGRKRGSFSAGGGARSQAGPREEIKSQRRPAIRDSFCTVRRKSFPDSRRKLLPGSIAAGIEALHLHKP